jgi:hypothetical protein
VYGPPLILVMTPNANVRTRNVAAKLLESSLGAAADALRTDAGKPLLTRA